MAGTRIEQVQALFAAALERPPAERSAYLESACEGDAALLAELEALLASAERMPPSFLDPDHPPTLVPSWAVEDPDDAWDAAERLIGKRIGRFTLERVIGGGGMGVVFEARQERPQRTVALKLLRPGLASRETLRRFELEAELLGRLKHPNIAQVYDAGLAETPLGTLPYFAMEYIEDAQPLTEYADAARLDVRQRLELMVQVCDAVQHAHQQGVIHRDLKPANILVRGIAGEGTEGWRDGGIKGGSDRTSDADAGRGAAESGPASPSSAHPRAETDQPKPEADAGAASRRRTSGSDTLSYAGAEPQSLHPSIPQSLPKIIDFGVARVRDADLATLAQRTAPGQIVGTVQYMSPEQCEGDPAAVDTRTDVYSLGVILYELLTGALPYHATSVSLTAAARAIREHEPVRPATINRKLRGDLETVILKALEKDRERRYATAEALARDLRHVLAGEPVEARPPTVLTRAMKWAVRHPLKVTLALCAVIVLATAAGIGTLWWYATTRPDTVLLVESKRDAVLRAVAGRELQRWHGGCENAFAFGRLVRGAAEDSASRFVVLGLGELACGDLHPGLHVFDLKKSLRKEAWWDTVEAPVELPEAYLKARTLAGQKPPEGQLGATAFLVADMFPEEPGQELLVAYNGHGNTQTCFRIHRLPDGEVLWQVWADFRVVDLAFLPDSNLLVVAGRNGRATWIEREGDTGKLRKPNQHPLSVLAIRPRLGVEERHYIADEHPQENLRTEWEYYLAPPEEAERFVFGPEPEDVLLENYDGSSEQLGLSLRLANDPAVGLTWYFKAEGPVDRRPRSAGSYDQYVHETDESKRAPEPDKVGWKRFSEIRDAKPTVRDPTTIDLEMHFGLKATPDADTENGVSDPRAP